MRPPDLKTHSLLFCWPALGPICGTRSTTMTSSVASWTRTTRTPSTRQCTSAVCKNNNNSGAVTPHIHLLFGVPFRYQYLCKTSPYFHPSIHQIQCFPPFWLFNFSDLVERGGGLRVQWRRSHATCRTFAVPILNRCIFSSMLPRHYQEVAVPWQRVH